VASPRIMSYASAELPALSGLGLRSLPRELKDFRNYHAGETILVCGCGTSLNDVVSPERFITIGVNDVGRMFQPDYLVVLNPRQQFKPERFRFVEQSQAKAVFTQLDLGIRHPHIVRFRLGRFGGVDFSDPTCLPHTRNSPYVALCLAIHMGAKKIGLIGVDFTHDHFFGSTGEHPLSRAFAQIDLEYKRLYEASRRLGIEVLNLSSCSRLTALPKITSEEFAKIGVTPKGVKPVGRKIFFVNYKFLSCGDVFREGLKHAAGSLQLSHDDAYWDDPNLPDKVRQFAPDVLFVVHGRRFAQRWKNQFAKFRSAVWLLDEPYEVDDTARFSNIFDTVFLNDPTTLHRHRNAHHLPVCYNPERCFYRPGEDRPHAVGFIGGFNPLREETLEVLASRGLLSYVIGGPWRKSKVQALNVSGNIPAQQTIEWYRNTKIVLNVFRTQHHFNRSAIAAHSLNPRIYEALGCGALVISQDRPERAEICPHLPIFQDSDELVSLVEQLLRDPIRFHHLRKLCIRQFAHMTYAARLNTVLATIFAEETTLNPRIAPEVPRQHVEVPPTFSILMAVHNALAVTQLSTLKTLRNIRNQDATLVVVDNASDDGAGEWLKVLAERGDIQLISNRSNLGHGPALEQARRATRSPYVVTLDSDAFPLQESWLRELQARLTGGVKLAGILHHRDYIHPSCLMTERRTLDELGVTFLDEKGQRSQFDVAERISHEVKRHGYCLSGLEQTGAQRRGSISEPVYLGAEYSGIIHHQWYTTRAVISAGRRVDDVPAGAIESSLEELFRTYHAEPRQLAVIMGIRAAENQPDRLRNVKACLRAFNLQDLERCRYRIIVVEQDSEPRLESALAPFVDRYIFAYNPGPFNRGWGFNVGASVAAAEEALCLTDADLLPAPTFLSAALQRFRNGSRAVRPYTELVYLDKESTDMAIATRQAQPMCDFSVDRYSGQVFRDSVGVCVWVEPRLYQEMMGHDERFRGWGWEDREFCRRLGKLASIEVMSGRLAHLDHGRPNMSDRWALANSELNKQLAAGRDARCWHGPMGDLNRYAGEKTRPSDPTPNGRREWENWHRWSRQRIEDIVTDEARRPIQCSTRWRLAQVLRYLGKTLLDVGCGPGALWVHLEPHRDHISWMGVDATPQMLDAARRKFPRVPALRADSGYLPFDSAEFEVLVMRHLLEHLPPWLMERSLAEAMRVAQRAVVLNFAVPPSPNGSRYTRRVGENFLETCWTTDDIQVPVTKAGWSLKARFTVSAEGPDRDEVWILTPQTEGGRVREPADSSATSAMPKVSIIMPTYRRCHTIFRTLQTIWSQTYQNWELILVDNAGDGKYWFADPRVHVHQYNVRASASDARNFGLKHASGELVCFFDDDDDMFANYLERLVGAFRENPSAKMVRCGMVLSGGQVNYSHATPECCLRRQYATPTWNDRTHVHDQHYFQSIATAGQWSQQKGDIIVLHEALCRANRDPLGGLRQGRL
jgi:glycosyltransferase involved in cell wall biosynthesis